MNANPKASTVRAGCGVRKVTGRKYARKEKGARSRSVHVGGVWSIAQVGGRRGLENRGAKEEVEANIRGVARFLHQVFSSGQQGRPWLEG